MKYSQEKKHDETVGHYWGRQKYSEIWLKKTNQ